MSQELVEGTLNEPPRSEKTRELVTKWLNSLKENLDSHGDKLRSSSDHSGSGREPEDRSELEDAGYEGDSSDEAQGRTPVSIVKRKSKRLGSTVSQDGPHNSRKGSTASSGGPANGKGSSTPKRPSRKRKRSTASKGGPTSSSRSQSDCLEHQPKRQRLDSESETDSDQDDQSGLTEFDPASLVKSKEGTFSVPSVMKKYLNKHMKRCLSKEEREAIFKEHPKPDLHSCSPPKVDKYISEFLGKRLPKEHDSELAKIQSAILAGVHPLTSAWQLLLDNGLGKDPEMVVPASEVLTLIQCSLCMIGNASELVSQTRRSKILDTIDHSWSKFGEGDFPSAKDTLFGEEFQASLTTKVEKDNALSKAVSITKRNKKHSETPSSSRREGQQNDHFFSRGPSCQVRWQAGQKLPVQSTLSTEEGRKQQGNIIPELPKAGLQTAVPRAQATARPVQENSAEEAIKLLKSLPKSKLENLGIKVDMNIVQNGAQLPVGGRLAHFAKNWEEISNDPWILETIRGYQVEFHTIPQQVGYPNEIQLDATQSQALTKEVEELVRKEAIVSPPYNDVGFMSQMFLVPKSDGSWRPVINLKSLNKYVIARHFKMESIRTAKGLMQTGDWLVKLDLKDAYFSVPIHPSSQKFLKFKWRGQTWQFKALPFGLSSAPCFHQVDETSGLHIKKVGDQIYSVSRRHVDNVKEQRRSQETLGDGSRVANSTGIYHQLEEECPFPDSGVGIPRVCLEFSQNDNITPVTQATLLEEASKANEEPGEDHGAGVGTDPGNNGSCTPCDTPSTTPLQEPRGSQDKSAEGRVLIRFPSECQLRHEARSDLVGGQCQPSQWTSTTDYTLGPYYRVGCFHNWMGSQLPRKEHWGPMDTTGEKLSHQLSRAPGSFPCSEVICSSGDFNLNPASAGQCNSHCLFEQDGRYSFSVTVQTGSTDLGLVHREEHNNSCRASSREAKCTSRLGVSSHDRLQRLATPSRHLSPTSGEFWPVHSGFIRFPDEYPTTDILQLETRSGGSYSGCPFHFMGKPLSLYVPTFCSDLSVFEQTQGGKSNSSSDSASLDKSGMVPSTSTELDRFSDPSSSEPQHLDKPTGHSTPHGNGGPSTSGRVACLRRSYRTEGLSDGVYRNHQKVMANFNRDSIFLCMGAVG